MGDGHAERGRETAGRTAAGMRDIADAVDIREIAQALGVSLGKNNKTAYCPEHSRGPGRGTPSISFYKVGGRQKFKCHSCGAGGDVLDLVSLVKSCPVGESAKWVEGKPVHNGSSIYPKLESEPEVSTKARVLACTAFMQALDGVDDFGLNWLLKERGILSESATKHRLASLDERSASMAMGAAIQATDVQTCVNLGLSARSGKTDTLYCPAGFSYHIAIPYITDSGRVAHIQFRRISRSGDKVDRKYIHLKGGVPMPYNIPATIGRDRVFVVEGALDAIALGQMGVPAVGVPGTGWLNEDRAKRLIRRAGTECELVVGFDADDAGAKAADKLVDELQCLGNRPLRVVWPSGFSGDWCDWMMARPDESPDVVEACPEMSKDEEWIGNLMSEGVDDLVAVAAGEKASSQVRTGYVGLDRVLEVQKGDMVVVAARPSVGKSHFVLSVMQQMAQRFGSRSLFVSLEMSKPSVARRISSAQMGIGKDSTLQASEMSELGDAAKKKFKELPILVNFGSRKLDRIIDYIRSSVGKYDIDIVAIDYLQLIESAGRSEHEEIGKASRQLKALSNELLVPIIAVVQMNRAIEGRQNGVPMMSDLRGSGQIEQDADAILFLDRPYVRTGEDFSDFRIVIGKQRNGATGRLRMHLPEPFGWLQDSPFDYQSGS